ncbi:MAG: MMPL family transporter [Chlorobi bacterium]|nr:MMPL family transporter [Chlorobiota bacterium]
MWTKVARIILRNRLFFLIIIGLFTAFMAYKASFVKLSYQYVKMLPDNDSASLAYSSFKKQFGEDGTVFGVAIKDSNFFNYPKINDWYALGNNIKKVKGVNEVLSIAHLYVLKKNSKLKKFEIEKVLSSKIKNQHEADSFSNYIHALPFYRNFLLNDSTQTYLLAINLDKKEVNSKDREEIISVIKEYCNNYSQKYGLEIHYSGMPYIRTVISKMIKHELLLFIALATIICIIILYSFFRSLKVTFFSILIVSIAVIWAFGTIVLLGYKITILTGIIPPLIIVIGIPNCIFLLNKYHQEYKLHGNKIKALQRVIQKVGNATFLTNLTTASGFSTFIITKSEILTEFGIVASINVIGVFVLSILLIPIVFSFLPPPTKRHTKHLDYVFVGKIINKLEYITFNKRTIVYIVTAIILILGIYGTTLMKSTGYVVDDISKSDPLYVDLKFFEKNFNGVIPFEIEVDTKRKKGAVSLKNIKKVERLQKTLRKYPELSNPISFNEVIKYAKQAFYNGNEKYYKLPSNQEKNFILSYASKELNKGDLLHAYIDSTDRIMRISYKILDVGTVRMKSLSDSIRVDIDKIFSPKKYNVTMTGTSIVFFKGTNYLIKNLFISLILAILIISFILFWMFTSFRMIIISLIPNLIPLLLTAALMGYFNIAIKPSTILVFSVAFGISVDGTIHFLAKFRQELKGTSWDIGKSVTMALRETGVSIFYTTIVLFFGFGIFVASRFGGTVALGALISITLLNAMFANLILLPSLLLTLEKSITKESFHEPLLQIYNEEEDIELDELKLQSNNENNITTNNL